MRVAIVHYWLINMRGGEKVLEELCQMFPGADIFTHVVDREAISPIIARHKITTSFIAKLPCARRMFQNYLPLMPMALEQLDLQDYDLVLSSESGPAKGIIPAPGALHVCYCHSPMRYIWNMYPQYRASAGLFKRAAMPFLTHYLRNWDQSSSTRVDAFVANSTTVADRIRKYYRREATVIHPPVATADFAVAPRDQIGDYYLMAGALVRYKRPDLAVEAFNRTGKRLVVIGGGEELSNLRKRAGDNIEFLGVQPFDVLKHHLAHAKGLIFPGEEDFGIVPVEAMASGRPVVAFGRGGVLDSVIDGQTGTYFHGQSVEELIDAIEMLERMDIDPVAIRRHAARFGRERFRREMRAFIAKHWADQGRGGPREAAEPLRNEIAGRMPEPAGYPANATLQSTEV